MCIGCTANKRAAIKLVTSLKNIVHILRESKREIKKWRFNLYFAFFNVNLTAIIIILIKIILKYPWFVCAIVCVELFLTDYREIVENIHCQSVYYER